MSFMFNGDQLAVLKNFSAINSSMVIHPDRFEVLNIAKSVVGKYKFEKDYKFDAFGIYEVSELLSIFGALKAPEIEANEKFLTINDGSSKIKYFTTQMDLLPKVPDIQKNFEKVKLHLDFELSAEKLASLFKTSSILKAQFAFFESREDYILITVADDLNTSNNSFEVIVDTGITTNTLKKALKIPLVDLKLIPGDYSIKMSESKISKWICFNGVEYFIGCASL